MKDKYNLTLEQNVFLAKKILVSSIYSSAKLEGLNVTYPETQTILDGVNVPNLKLDEINCILNLRDAWKYVLNSINEELNLDYICKINSYVSRNESLNWGVLRSGNVGISGTNYIPEVPNKEIVINELEEISNEESITKTSIKLMLYCMRSQLFWDGNKRTSTIAANKLMISNGNGIILIKEEFLNEFNALLSDFYNTNNYDKIMQFIHENCIFGIDGI
ncbi:MAG: Fic family protein [Oscillospiraceae bacterium]|nr:Fic family protein [Oscillospiraceae bacterium]